MLNKLVSNKTFIIAELSANHNNDLDIALKTIKAIAETGADAVKIQTYTADSLSLNVDNEYFGPKKEGLWKGWRPYDLYKAASTPYEWHEKMKQVTEDLGMLFFSSPFDKEGIDFLESLNVPIYKIASFEINDIPLIKYAASKQKPMIISTGLGDENDIELAVKTCKEMGNNDITLLKCTSQYPARIEDANLSTIPDMKKRFETKVGLSDHTLGYLVPLVAVTLGATVVEKHFVLDRAMGGIDSKFSMEPKEFKEMVEQIRNVEKSLGLVNYEVSEKDKLRRRSLFAVKDIIKGELLNEENIRSLRPGYGDEPKTLENIINKKAKIDIKKGTPFNNNYLE
jgi:pseudaminic acid synthase